MRARRTAATTTALLATLALSGCEKPTPWVTLYSSGDTVKSRATIWCFEGQSIEARDCREGDGTVTEVPVASASQVAVDVDRELLHRGFSVVVVDPQSGQEQQLNAPQFEHYFTFDLPAGFQVPEEGLPVQVRAHGGEEDPAAVTGVYEFALVPD